jgi:hypothetical protein
MLKASWDGKNEYQEKLFGKVFLFLQKIIMADGHGLLHAKL